MFFNVILFVRYCLEIIFLLIFLFQNFIEKKNDFCFQIKREMEESAARLAQKKKLRPDLLKLLKEAREEHDKRLANLNDLKSNLLEVEINN